MNISNLRIRNTVEIHYFTERQIKVVNESLSLEEKLGALEAFKIPQLNFVILVNSSSDLFKFAISHKKERLTYIIFTVIQAFIFTSL